MKNTIKKIQEKINNYEFNDAISIMYELAYEDEELYEIIEGYNGLISDEMVEMAISEKWQFWDTIGNIIYRLADVKEDDYYFYIDGYGNLHNVDKDNLSLILDCIEDYFEYKEEENEQ